MDSVDTRGDLIQGTIPPDEVSTADIDLEWLEKLTSRIVTKSYSQLSPDTVSRAVHNLTDKDKLVEFTESLERFIQSYVRDNTVVIKTELNHQARDLYPAVEETDYERYLTTGQVKDMLSCSINTVKNHINNFLLVGAKLKEGGGYKLPVWQFHHGSAIKGIDDVLHILGANGVEAVRKFTMPMTRFQDRRIIDVLREGDIALAKEMASYLSVKH